MGKTISKSVWARLMQENFVKPLNYPELKSWERPILWNTLKEKQITKEIAEDNIKDELIMLDIDGKPDNHYYIEPQLWCNLCALGWIYRDNGKTRDIEIWTRKMVRSLWEDYIPWLGATWRILENFAEDEIDFYMLEESFELVSAMQRTDFNITAGTIFRKLDEQMENSEKTREYQDYIDAIFAGWEEFQQPTFVTTHIQDILNAREKFCPKCNRRYEVDVETCERCDCKLEYGNRYVCFHCEKYVSDEFMYCPYCGTTIDRYPNKPMHIDTIEFALQKFTFGAVHEPSDTAAIYVNGESFRDIIWRAEYKIAREAGAKGRPRGYAWLYVWELLDELTQKQDVNSEDYLEPKVLGCGCGVSDCDPLHVKITETDDIVTWSGFYNPFNSDPEMTKKPWEYSKIRAYHFDKKQYYAEIEKLQKWYNERYKDKES